MNKELNEMIQKLTEMMTEAMNMEDYSLYTRLGDAKEILEEIEEEMEN